MREIIYFFNFFMMLTLVSAQAKDVCTMCVRKDQCMLINNMNPTEQNIWISEYPCTNLPYNSYYAIYNKGNFVCCSDSLYNDFIRRYGVSNEDAYPGGKNIVKPDYTTTPPTEYPQIYYPSGPNDASGGIVNPLPGNVNGNVNGGTVRPVTQSPIYYTVLPPFGSGKSQCQASSFPPNPESGCCGFEASESDRISVTSTARPVYPMQPYPYYPQKSPNLGLRIARNVNNAANDTNVSIDNRIAGGSETDFFQYPWTVQLISTFDYGQRRQSFDCGGSLISSRYVLTAGHCTYDTGGTLTQVQAYLAEYDRTTFPDDCKTVLGARQQCIHNIILEGEEVVRHSQYDDDKLLNDIALIRLRENAPYSAFIRPICLTPIDIDDTNFANLRLAVAGWGRNGRYKSNIKQSTVLNLVPQEQCKKYYPNLIRTQMCAVGYSGEDTCKGDSGGPLMTVNGQKYYVVGVVSGKRADAPCGTSVPSLYTNVYQYLDWIYSNIRN